MPLASWAALHWYGPAAGAARLNEAAGAIVAGVKAFGDPDGALAGTAAITNADATRLVNAPAALAGASSVASGPMRARARIAAPIRVGEFTQDDVSGGVLNAVVEGEVTLAEALRLLLAHASGNATGLDGGTIAFKSLDGSKTRVGGTVSGGTRTVTTRDGS